MAIKRRDGQIWIDKNNTHRLKYHIDNTTYEVATSQTFASNDIPSVKKGQLVVSTGGTLAKAVWPDDAERVLGIVTATEDIENSKYVTSVSSSGRIILSAEEIAKCFVDGTALPVSTGGNSWATEDKKGIGCPVYWFIGLSKTTDEYIDSSDEDRKGMLTFKTPSGFKYGVTTVDDEKFNISYDNLPIVGHIVDYSYSGDSFTELVIDLQVATYTPVVTWNYPGIHYGSHECGKLGNGPHKFYHGLFANNAKNNICICDLTARAIPVRNDYPADAEEYTVVIPYKNIMKADNDRYTEISISSAETLRYRITGTVHYNIDRSQA